MSRVPRPSAHVVWWLAVVATVLNGVAVWGGSVWLQFFGDSPDRGDYLVAAGGLLTAGAVVGVGAAAATDARVSRFSAGVVLVTAVSLLLAGVGALQRAAELPAHDRPSAGLADGVGGVVLLPWSWALLWLAGRAGLRRLRPHRTDRT